VSASGWATRFRRPLSCVERIRAIGTRPDFLHCKQPVKEFGLRGFASTALSAITADTDRVIGWRPFMRGSQVACLLVLNLLAGQMAVAQSGPPADKSDKAREIDERVAYWLKTCLADWDQATHMTKGEWRTTCQRVSAERRTFLMETPDAASVGTKRGR
jgi:hypothetical protein